jgi:carboxypeptidase T
MKLFIVFLISCLSAIGYSQSSKLKVDLDPISTEIMIQYGMEMDHGTIKKGHFIINDFSAQERAWLDESGISYEVLVEDVERFYVNRSSDVTANIGSRADCTNESSEEFETPENFSTGSMGGFFTYQEFLDHLDAMATEYPDLISARSPIDTFLTHENRPIYWLKISDNPNSNEPEPEVLYTSIHHAREPQSLAQLIFYMWYLLENYGTNDEVTYLVDNTEMYFIPMINPDGYIENETSNPNGGGLWRKNKRDNGNGTMGVDLNRNYEYKWGFDNIGSEPNPLPGSLGNTYRGPSPASEPETKAVQWFCEDHEFQLALNYHSHGNYLIYPWGYIPSPLSPDSNYFIAIAEQMTAQNNYVYGTGYETVNYATNGVSDDWMYGEENTKNKIFSMTPEVGNSGDGFWPIESRIIPLSEENVRPNMLLSHFAGHYITMEDVSESRLASLSGTIAVEFERLGLEFDPNHDFTFSPISSNVMSGPEVISFNTMNIGELDSANFAYQLNSNIQAGDLVIFELEYSYEGYSKTIEITKIYGEPTIALQHKGDSMTDFSSFGWDVTDEIYFSPLSSITDSPYGLYSNNDVSELEYERIIDMRQSLSGYLTFHAQWQIEAGYDYVQIMAAPIGTENWSALCGLYTKEGQPEQDQGQPLWDGNQVGWVKEQIEMNDYIGQRVKLKFRLMSDQFVTYDGYYLDDFQFVTLLDASSSTPLDTGYIDSAVSVNEVRNDLQVKVYPNPATNEVRIIHDLGNEIIIKVFDLQGNMVLQKSHVDSRIKLDVSMLSPGSYLISCEHRDDVYRQPLLIIR